MFTVKQKRFTKCRMVLDENIRICLLNDFYGSLLTETQQSILNDYLNLGITLSEIAENRDTTRQSVLDTIKKATKKLDWYESKLSMLSKYLKQKQILDELSDKQLAKKLMKIWK